MKPEPPPPDKAAPEGAHPQAEPTAFSGEDHALFLEAVARLDKLPAPQGEPEPESTRKGLGAPLSGFSLGERLARGLKAKGKTAGEATPQPAPPPAPGRRVRLDNPWRWATRDVTPLPPANRADLHNPLPAALPRQPATLIEDGERNDRPGFPPAAHQRPALPPRELFLATVGPVAPLPDSGRVELDIPRPPPQPRQRELDEKAVLEEAMSTPLSFEDRLDMGDEPAFLRPGLARKVLTDLRRGRWVIEGEIDLHGFNRIEARKHLAAFLAFSLTQGRRCLRVIHGKGLRSPGRLPVLKHLSRTWLAQRQEILAFCQARPQDGGEGALLVLLHARRPGQPHHHPDTP